MISVISIESIFQGFLSPFIATYTIFQRFWKITKPANRDSIFIDLSRFWDKEQLCLIICLEHNALTKTNLSDELHSLATGNHIK